MAINETKALLELSKIRNSTADWDTCAAKTREIALDLYERCKGKNLNLREFNSVIKDLEYIVSALTKI